MSAIDRLIETARAEVGYLEKETNAQLDSKTSNAGDKNWTKYARDLDNMGVVYNGRKNGYAWCDAFCDWCFIKTFGLEAGMKLLCQPEKSAGAGCTESARYYKQAGRFHKSGPQRGDQIFFTKNAGKSCYHTGLVMDVRGGTVYTIEGNTGSAPGVVENGGTVREKSYSIYDAKIAGYGRPDYTIVEEETDMEIEEIKEQLTSCVGTGDHPSNYAKESVEFCKEHKIFNGNGNGDFGWQQPITREAVACIIHRTLQALGVADKM